MSLATRCPRCNTVFRLLPDQLRMHRNQVRCGHCDHVFDGAREQLDARLFGSTTEPGQAAGNDSAGSQGTGASRAEPTFGDPGAPLGQTAGAGVEPSLGTRSTAGPTFASQASSEPFLAGTAAQTSAPGSRSKRPGSAKRGLGSVLGVIIAALLGVALGAQTAWWQHERVMVALPESQSWFESACTYFGCSIGPVHDVDLLRIEVPTLRQVDGAHRLEFKMTLFNQGSLVAAYPALNLTLLDQQNQVAIRKVLLPADYLPAGVNAAAGLAPGARQVLAARLDTGSVTASNYRVVLFTP